MPVIKPLATNSQPGQNGHVNSPTGKRLDLGWKTVSELPRNLRAFGFHKLNFKWQPGWSNSQVTCDCPLCYRENKFYIAVETGLWGCKLCSASGNPLTFLRQLWERSFDITDDWNELCKERKLLHTETLMSWGCCKSASTGEWLVPAYGMNKEGIVVLTQLYRRHRLLRDNKWMWCLSPTPGIWLEGDSHGLFGLQLFDHDVELKEVCVAEGPWDGMALWETLRDAGRKDNVIAAPGCNVWKQDWCGLLKGKAVSLLYDSDLPRVHPVSQEQLVPVGYGGMKRVTRMLLSDENPPESVSYLAWGLDGDGEASQGYSAYREDGYDVRDFFSQESDLAGRVLLLDKLFALVQPIPDDWREGVAVKGQSSKELTPEPCHDYRTMMEAWSHALSMRESLSDVLTIMLAVSASTMQVGDQLFLQVIGQAGSGKSRLCDAMLVSKHCFPLEHLTGFHSGWKDGSGEDFSLLSRINGKCLITPEADVMMSNPRFGELMSQQRRIFDGASGATFKNRKEDMRWTGLRTPWIMAGTPALMDHDQSRLGDRFLKVFIHPPDEDQRRSILRMVVQSAVRSVMHTSNCDPASSVDGVMLDAYRLTGGYVEWLRANMEEEVNKLRINVLAMEDVCCDLAEFTASMRARPQYGAKIRDKLDSHDGKELPSRLAHQFARLACCVAVVMNQPNVNDDVLRLVRKVAFDTSQGVTLRIVDALATAGYDGADLNDLQIVSNLPPEKLGHLLGFLSTDKVGVLEQFEDSPSTRGWRGMVKWRLTTKMASTYERVGRVRE